MMPIFSHQDITELRLICNTAVRKRRVLAEQYECLRQELEKKRKQREDFRRNLAVTERQIKDIQKDIFMMNSVKSDLDEASVAMLMEVGNKEKQLSELKDQANNLTHKINTTATDMQQALVDVAALESAYSSISHEVASLEKEKYDLSGDIAKCLENTSLERKKVESELNDLSTAFLRIIDERKNAEEQLSDQKTASEKCVAIMDELTQKLSILEAIMPMLDEKEAVQQDVVQLETEIESLNVTRRALLKEMNDQQKQLETLAVENLELNATITDLETEVGLYEKIISEVMIAQAASTLAKSQMSQVSDELMEKLIEKAVLDQAIQDIWRQFDALAILTGSHSGS
jgi:chromosome segregation ATPase